MRSSNRVTRLREHGGFGYRRVTVVSVGGNDGFARCRDNLNQETYVTLRYRTGKGGWPRVGEEWYISKEFLGRWVFVGLVSPSKPPVISAPREGMDKGTEQIFDALLALGLVNEEGTDFQRTED